MISRQDNNFQDKKKMVTFGQLILPLTIVIALGLLFFSVRLFFYTPMNPEKGSVMEEESKQLKEIIKEKQEQKSAETEGVKSASRTTDTAKQSAAGNKTDLVHVSINPAKPIKNSTTQEAKKDSLVIDDATSKKRDAERVAKKETKAGNYGSTMTVNGQTKNKKHDGIQEPQKQKALKTEKQPKPDTTGNAKRWDVQIGGFAEKARALSVMKKAQSEGYKAYLSEGNANNASFYRIRVKGSEDKKTAEKLSAELAGKKYPVYLIEIQ